MDKKELKTKKELVERLSDVYKDFVHDFDYLDFCVYHKKGTKQDQCEEFIRLVWKNGAWCCCGTNWNSLTANAQVVASMLNGGKYENKNIYTMIMESDEWERVEL